MITFFKKHSYKCSVLGLAVIIVLSGCALTNAKSNGETWDPTQSKSSSTIDSTDELPFSLHTVVETPSFKFAIPSDWTLDNGNGIDTFTFQKNGKTVGETEVLGWFDSGTWKNFSPNHTEQTSFKERSDLLTIKNKDIHIYRIQLTHTKPAAMNDPDWEYNETRWYVAVKENERSYGFYFNNEQIDENTMETIISTFRLKP